MREIRILLRLKWKIFRSTLRSLKGEPPAKTAVVAGFIALWTCGGFILMYDGVVFLSKFTGIGDYLIGRLLYLFAFGIFTMLVFSSIVLSPTVLFDRAENAFLLSKPVSIAALMVIKLCETTVLSSWALVMMAAPLVTAYFLAAGYGFAPLVLSLPFFLPLALICGAIGTLVSLLIHRYLPAPGRWAKAFVALGFCGAVCAMWRAGAGTAPDGDQSLKFVSGLVGKCELADWFLLPSSWAARGIMSVCGGHYGGALFLLFVLISNALFLSSLCIVAGERMFGAAYDRRSCLRGKQAGGEAVSRILRLSPFWGMVSKDVVTFLRDTSQWGQFAVFFGLLSLYVMNIRNLPYDLGNIFWRYLLATLNLSALAFMLAGLSSRFFFPLVSLELKELWFIGMTRMRTGGILREKFLLCAWFTVLTAAVLAILSGSILRLSTPLLVSTIFSAIIMAVTVSAISVGLGAVYPDPLASSPAEVVSGLGGAVVLVSNVVYVCGAVFLYGLPLYLHAKGTIPDAYFIQLLSGTLCLLALLSFAISASAMRAGRNRIEGIEVVW